MTIPVTNTGNVKGSEVVQIYVRDVKCSVYRPMKELKAFGKVNLAPGETTDVKLTLDKNAFAFYNTVDNKWTVEPGKFQLLIGNSSDNIAYKLQLDVTKVSNWED